MKRFLEESEERALTPVQEELSFADFLVHVEPQMPLFAEKECEAAAMWREATVER